MGRKLTWIVAALVAVGLVVVGGVVLLTRDDESTSAETDLSSEAGSPVGASLPAPSSPAAQAAAIAAAEQFWTPQRIRDALNNPRVPPPRESTSEEPASSSPAPSAPSAGAQAEPTMAETRSPRSATLTQGRCRQPALRSAERGFPYRRFCYRGSLNGYPARTTGRLLTFSDGGVGYCTATVAAASNQSVLITAGHCVVDPPGAPGSLENNKKPVWDTNFAFAPAPLVRRLHQALDKRDWEKRLLRMRSQLWWALPIPGTKLGMAWSPTPWIQNGYWSHDFAAIVIAPRVRNGARQTIQSILGAQGWDMSGTHAFAHPRLLGYPSANPFAGRTLFECRGAAKLVRSDGDPGPELKVGCDMSPGSSGGPWLAAMTAQGLGSIISVNSNGPPNVMYGPRLSSLHLDAMSKAQTTAVG